MTRRIWVNLVVFGALGIVMTVWALQNMVTFDFITRPRHITVEFSASPGLQPNFDVTYLGVRVGRIKSIRLGEHKVVAALDLDRDAKVPGNVLAAAGRKSVIGEPYVNLTLPPGAAPAPPMRGGETIPVSHTTVAASYDDLFAATDRAVQGLNPADLHTLTHELALGWDGRAGSVTELLDSSEQITSTFASNTQLLDSLISRLTVVSGTLAAHRDDLGRGLDGFTAFADVLAKDHAALSTVVGSSADLVARFNQIVKGTVPAQKCILHSLDQALPVVLSKPAMDSFRYQSQMSPQLVSVLKEIAPPGPTGLPNLNIDMVVTLNGPQPAVEFTSPRPLPTVGAIPACPGVAMQAATQSGRSASPGTGTAKPSQATISGRPVAQRDRRTGVSGDWLVIVPPLIGMLLLVAVGYRAAPFMVARARARLRNVRDRR